MKTGFSLCGNNTGKKLFLALYWPCTGLQCSDYLLCRFEKRIALSEEKLSLELRPEGFARHSECCI